MIKRRPIWPVVSAILVPLAILIALTSAIITYRGIIVKGFLEYYVNSATGLKLYVKKADIGIRTPHLELEEAVLMNPPGYPSGVMLDVPHFFIEIDPKAAIQREFRIKRLDLHLAALNVIRNKEGMVSVDYLNVSKFKPGPSSKPSKARFPIEKLKLKGARVTWTDLRFDPPKVTEFQVNVDQSYDNVTDPYALIDSIAKKSLSQSPLAGLDLSSIPTGITQAATAGRSMIRGAMGSAIGAIKDSINKNSAGGK